MENKPLHTGCKALFSTAYFPPIGMMAAMVQSDELLIELHETFPKQTHRNRTVILTANGPMTLSVPVLRPDGTHTRTSDIQIAYTERWNVIHWRAIESAYSSSPFFLYYRDEIEQLLMQRYRYLVEFNERLLAFLFKKLKKEIPIHYTETFQRNTAPLHDYRDRFSYKHPDTNILYPSYTQVFGDRQPFNSNVSVLDLLFNLGPEAKEYLCGIRL